MSDEMHSSMAVDEQQLVGILTCDELRYYKAAMTHLRIIDLKARRGHVQLTSQERSLYKATKEETFNVPQPLYAFISSIGSFSNAMGKTTHHDWPLYPAVAAGLE